jgi:hypothetical protein
VSEALEELKSEALCSREHSEMKEVKVGDLVAVWCLDEDLADYDSYGALSHQKNYNQFLPLCAEKAIHQEA